MLPALSIAWQHDFGGILTKIIKYPIADIGIVLKKKVLKREDRTESLYMFSLCQICPAVDKQKKK